MANIEVQGTTINIRNAGKVLILKIVALNEISGHLKNNRFKTPHYAYSNRSSQFSLRSN